MSDITACYYTANRLPEPFASNVRSRLLESTLAANVPIVSVSQSPINLGRNICVGPIGSSLLNLYTQVLIAARYAETPYVALVEDDCLYPPSHFTCYRPPPNVFGYNQNKWFVLVWDNEDKAVLSNKEHRCVLNQCIAHRQLLIESLEERFEIVARTRPSEDRIDMHFAEPGRHEKWLGFTERTKHEYWSPEPSIVFCHLYANIDKLGKRRRHGEIRAKSCVPWGSAAELIRKYVGEEEWHRERRA